MRKFKAGIVQFRAVYAVKEAAIARSVVLVATRVQGYHHVRILSVRGKCFVLDSDPFVFPTKELCSYNRLGQYSIIIS